MGRLRAFLLCLLVGCMDILAETWLANPQCARNCCHNDADFVLFKTKPDCTIIHKAADTEILAHKAVLAASIPFFNDAFVNNPSDMIRVELNADLNLSAIQCLVNFAYKQVVRIHSRNVEDLLRTARFLRVSNVVDACTTFLTKRFTPENVIGTLNMANLSQFAALRSQAEEYAHRHFYNLTQTRSILDLNADAFVHLLDSNDLNLSSEEPVFDVAIRWLEHKPVRSEKLWDVLKHVRYLLLPLHYLTTQVQTDSRVRSSPSVQELVDEAIQYSSNPYISQQGCHTRQRNGTAKILGLELAKTRLQIIDPIDKRIQYVSIPITYLPQFEYMTAAVHQCSIYMFVGDKGISSASFLRPPSKLWLDLTYMNENTSRRQPAAATMNDRIYVSGGYNEESTLNTVTCFNPYTRTWSMVAPMLEPRVEHQLIVFEDSLYALGGRRDASENALKSVERLDAKRNKWISETPMLVERRAMGVAELNGKLYACGGYHQNTYLKSAEVFDPIRRTWKLISPMSVGKKSFSLLAHNGKLYAVLINIESVYVDVYDPETNEWSIKLESSVNPAKTVAVMMHMLCKSEICLS